MRGFRPAAHYLNVENHAASFQDEAAAMRTSAADCLTDAICRLPRLRRTFEAETIALHERLRQLEEADHSTSRRITRRTVRYFWGAVFLASAAAFTAGYLTGLRL